jgi:hypothetical protein
LIIKNAKKEGNMSDNKENKQQSEQKQEKKQEETKDWMDLLQDFIKNPVTTGITGLAAGYFIGTFMGNKEKESLKQEHHLQMKERDEQIKLLIEEMRTTNRLIVSKLRNALPSGEDKNENEEEDKNTIPLVEDKKTKTYKYQPKKKHIQLKG